MLALVEGRAVDRRLHRHPAARDLHVCGRQREPRRPPSRRIPRSSACRSSSTRTLALDWATGSWSSRLR